MFVHVCTEYYKCFFSSRSLPFSSPFLSLLLSSSSIRVLLFDAELRNLPLNGYYAEHDADADQIPDELDPDFEGGNESGAGRCVACRHCCRAKEGVNTRTGAGTRLWSKKELLAHPPTLDYHQVSILAIDDKLLVTVHGADIGAIEDELIASGLTEGGVSGAGGKGSGAASVGVPTEVRVGEGATEGEEGGSGKGGRGAAAAGLRQRRVKSKGPTHSAEGRALSSLSKSALQLFRRQGSTFKGTMSTVAAAAHRRKHHLSHSSTFSRIYKMLQQR
jgi:hypothetical protein